MYMAFGVAVWEGFTFGKCICNKLVFLEKSGKNHRKSGKSQGISWDKKSGNPDAI